MGDLCQCPNCGWCGPVDDAVEGIPDDFEGDYGDADYYRDTPSCCPECNHDLGI